MNSETEANICQREEYKYKDKNSEKFQSDVGNGKIKKQ